MYLGKIVEYAETEILFKNYFHPYTKALMDAIPDIEKKKVKADLKGDIPSPTNKPSGCYYRTRCKEVMDICGETYPVTHTENNHSVACHLKLK